MKTTSTVRKSKKIPTGKEVVHFRNAFHLTQQELADLLGMKRPNLARIEASKRLPIVWQLLIRVLSKRGKAGFKDLNE